MKLTNAIVLTKGGSDVKAIAAIRKSTKLPISEIRSCIEAGKPIIEADTNDTAGLKHILSLYRELSSLGLKPELFEAGFPVSYEFFCAVEGTHEEIAREIEAGASD